MAGGRYSISVPMPSTRTREYAGTTFRIYLPSNWREFPGSSSDATFAPDGAYGSQGITHGVMLGVIQPQSNGLRNATDTFVRSLVSGNSYLRQQSSSTNANVGSNRGYVSSLVGRSPVTNRNENVNVYTAELRDGRIFYLITVAPESESYSYDNAFRNIVSSVQLN